MDERVVEGRVLGCHEARSLRPVQCRQSHLRASCRSMVVPAVSVLLVASSLACSPIGRPIDRHVPYLTSGRRQSAARDLDVTHVLVSADIRGVCGLPESARHFVYDPARPSDSSQKILAQIAQCFEDGTRGRLTARVVDGAICEHDGELGDSLDERRGDAIHAVLLSHGLDAIQIVTWAGRPCEPTERIGAEARDVVVLLGN